MGSQQAKHIPGPVSSVVSACGAEAARSAVGGRAMEREEADIRSLG